MPLSKGRARNWSSVEAMRGKTRQRCTGARKSCVRRSARRYARRALLLVRPTCGGERVRREKAAQREQAGLNHATTRLGGSDESIR